jgi:hypothetical protein
MEATPRPLLEVEGLERYEGVSGPKVDRHATFFQWSQRDRAIMRLFRTIQFRRLRNHPCVLEREIPREMQDPDPYDSVYVFYCMRLKGYSV